MASSRGQWGVPSVRPRVKGLWTGEGKCSCLSGRKDQVCGSWKLGVSHNCYHFFLFLPWWPLVAMGGGESDRLRTTDSTVQSSNLTAGGMSEACLHCGGILHPPFDRISCCASKKLSCIFDIACFYERDFSHTLRGRLRLEPLLTSILCIPNI